MKLETIDIAGFGCLRYITFNLTQGLNVFFGPNEAGKSTLQQAIWALLYGFFKTDHKLRAETAALERFRPWSSGPYGGNLIYRLDNGRAYRVSRNFQEDDLQTTLSDADTGRDVTAAYDREKHGRVVFFQKQFGMSEEVFANTCFVRQAELHALAKSAQVISETIVNLSGTGSQDRSVNRAKAMLEEAIREQIGTTKAYTKPWLQARKRLEELKAEKAKNLAQRRALDAEQDTRLDLTAKQEELEEEVVGLQYVLAIATRDRLAERIRQIDTLLELKRQDENNLAELASAGTISAAQRTATARLYQEWLTCQRGYAEAEREAEAVGPRITSLMSDRQALITRLRPLESARDIPIERESEIRQFDQEWREAVRQFERSESDLRSAEAAIEEMRVALDSARGQSALLNAGPQKLHDKGVQLEAAVLDVQSAAREVQMAEEEWSKLSLPLEEYQRLEGRFSNFDFDRLAGLKEIALNSERLEEKARSSLSRTAAWVLALTGGLLAASGATTVALGLARQRIPLSVGGLAAAVLGIGVVWLGVHYLAVRTERERQAREASDKFGTELAEYGQHTVDELERGFHVFLSAQPHYGQRARAMQSLSEKEAALDNVEAEARRMLGFVPDAPMDAVILGSAEHQAQNLLDQLKELDAREGRGESSRIVIAEARRALSETEVPLRSALKASGLEGDDLGRNTIRFYELCENRKFLERLDADLRALNIELETLSAVEQRAKTAKIALDNASNELYGALRRAGIDVPAPERAFRLFESRAEQSERARSLRERTESRNTQIQALLGGQPLEQIQRGYADLAANAQRQLARTPMLKDLPIGEALETLQQKLATAQKQLAETATRLAVTEERIQRAMVGFRTLAEVEEGILAGQEEIDHLSFHGRALKMAMEQLAAVADEHNRNFLPRLNRVVGDSLGRVTGGRYSKVQIDNADLQVRVAVPERSDPVTPDLLSRGAQEQIYLLLRLGLTELMSTDRERIPLMLDDPLVNFDRQRLLRGLEFLVDLAAQTQTLLFTKDEEIVRWFREHHANAEAHSLHLLEQ